MGNSRKGDIPMDLPTRIPRTKSYHPARTRMETFCATQRAGGRAVIWSLPGLALIVDRPITPGAVVALIVRTKRLLAPRTSEAAAGT